MQQGKIGNTNALKYKDETELARLIEEYFDHCDDEDKPYTMSGLAYWLGIDRRTLINYGERDSFFALIKGAKDRVQAQLEENALNGKGNATFTIFNLKNNYGWKDKQEIESTENKITIVNTLPKDNENE